MLNLENHIILLKYESENSVFLTKGETYKVEGEEFGDIYIIDNTGDRHYLSDWYIMENFKVIIKKVGTDEQE